VEAGLVGDEIFACSGGATVPVGRGLVALESLNHVLRSVILERATIWTNLVYIGWALASLAVVLSPFGRGKLRIAEIIIGLGMWVFYWQIYRLKNFSYV
jgi:hypothetical protein